jgi:hypothetical protein
LLADTVLIPDQDDFASVQVTTHKLLQDSGCTLLHVIYYVSVDVLLLVGFEPALDLDRFLFKHEEGTAHEEHPQK